MAGRSGRGYKLWGWDTGREMGGSGSRAAQAVGQKQWVGQGMGRTSGRADI